MAYGGGTFTAKNKVLPGVYVNFVGRGSTSLGIADRGVCALVLPINWSDGDVITVDAATFARDAKALFGYPADADELAPVREALLHCQTVLVASSVSGGVKASLAVEVDGETVTVATATKAGTRGNSITIVVSHVSDVYTVKTLVDGVTYDSQTVTAASDLVDNAWVDFTFDSDTLVDTAGSALTGGTDVTVAVGTVLAGLDDYSYNTVGIAGTLDGTATSAVTSKIRSLREEYGVKVQAVISTAGSPDYEGVINVTTAVEEAGGSLAFWVAGLTAGLTAGQSATNVVYDGEYTVTASYTQPELVAAVNAGKFILHRVGEVYRVLYDINTLVTYTADKTKDFRDNKCIRLIDTVAVSVADLFTRLYLGSANTEDNRTMLQGDIEGLLDDLVALNALEDYSDVIVSAGSEADAVDASMTLVRAGTMTKLYIECVVS